MGKRETKKYLRNRWDYSYINYRDSITHNLINGKNLENLNLPKTQEGLIDLRGYRTPKEDRYEELSFNLDKDEIRLGIRIKDISFNKIDLSLSDFAQCDFYDCQFEGSKFEETRLWGANFYDCKFKNIRLHKSNFASSTFSRGLLTSWINWKINFYNVQVSKSNLSNSLFLGQNLLNCTIVDCKQGSIRFSDGCLKNVVFKGIFKNLFFKNVTAKYVDLSESILIGVQFQKSKPNGFIFPEGDTYYFSNTLVNDLNEFTVPQNWLIGDKERANQIIEVLLLHVDDYTQFIDMNFLDEEEIEIGKNIIKILTGGNNSYDASSR